MLGHHRPASAQLASSIQYLKKVPHFACMHPPRTTRLRHSWHLHSFEERRYLQSSACAFKPACACTGVRGITKSRRPLNNK